MNSLQKSVLITGCSAGGIGAALASQFHQRGYYVFATARNPSKISENLSRAANVKVLKLEVLSSDSIAAAVESVRKETNGRLDVLVNNSGGGGSFLPALDIPIEEGKRLFDLNFWAPLVMLQAFAPLLINAKGCIVNNTSSNAQLPLPLMSIYNASKAAFATASETWRHELQPLGVRTLTLYTCAVKTNFFVHSQRTELSEASNNFEIRDFVHKISDGRLQDGAIPSAKYARTVVCQVEKGASGPFWVGTNAFVARVACYIFPKSIFDSLVQSIVPISSEMAEASQKKRD
ncbi:hypothetical protein FZEAL_1676 [Fusarium zealandicum]|uniref:Short-chain dehydrogenase/reductase n=1 Tax=Fusarium zealandicum TaxID=1053134 RepID=A0A8H4USR3_9HYPO|nr:hypothetical protein FZEAL_1676 [Fusarium zealandicum]